MKKFLTTASFCVVATFAQANEFEPVMQQYLDEQVSSWAQSDAIVAAIRAQNGVTGGYDQAQIEALDQQWRGAVSNPSDPVIDGVLNSSLSNHLREIVGQAGGTIAEIIVMDAKGLNVGVSTITSDYWQGDEAKHAKTYGVGAGASLIDDVEYDESTQTYVGQVSVTVVDPDTGSPIGAVTVSLDAEALM